MFSKVVNCVEVNPVMFKKVWSALIAGRVNSSDVAQNMADQVETEKRDGFKKGPGQYFNWKMGELFKQRGIEWKKPTQSPVQEPPDPWDNEPSETSEVTQ